MAGHENREFNRAAGEIHRTTMQAADTLAALLVSPPRKPTLPGHPLTPRAWAWCMALLAAVPPHRPADVAEAHAALAAAAARWQDLVKSAKRPLAAFAHQLRELERAGVPLTKGGTVEGSIAAAIEAGTLTEGEAWYWRISLGLPDPKTAPARGA
jgi:hypothetical protein